MSHALKRLGNRALGGVLRHNYRAGNYRETVWVVGDGRSGTTWVSDLLNPRNQYRKMFEPFHPQLVTGMDVISPHQYIRPGHDTHPLLPIAESVFSGQFTHPRVDSRNRRLRYHGIVVKDIFATLFAGWAGRHFPELKIVLVLRNPFSVALSKRNKPDWLWLQDPRALLEQPDLVEDHLQSYVDLIHRIAEQENLIANYILIWAIVHMVALSGDGAERMKQIRYEALYENPLSEISALRGTLGIDSDRLVLPSLLQAQTPTRSAGETSHLHGDLSPVLAWKSQLEPRQIDLGFEILSEFPVVRDLYAN